jgi:hypothetical protein
LLVRVGFVWRLLAGEAVRGEGRWYGFMVRASCRYRRARVCNARLKGGRVMVGSIIVAAETGES